MNQPLPKKSLGQHWLHDRAILREIVAAGEVDTKDIVLEVGPGLGTLTAQLVKAAGKVIAVEADRELADQLSSRVKADNLEVVTQDILEFNLSELPSDYKVISNIPYYLTSKLIRILLEGPNSPSLAVLLVQKEVAERITAAPGAMSVLSFSVQYYAKAELVGIVAKEQFQPIPKVDSAILKIKRREQPYFAAEPKELFRLVKAGFGERRKQLKNSLSGGLQLASAEAEALLKSAGIAPTARAQELSLDDWEKLYRAYTDSK